MATYNIHKDKLVVCPFDKNHKIAVRNQIKHIIECEKKIDSKFSVCIYNASHRMPRHEFAHHIKNCSDSRQFLREVISEQTKSDDIKPETISNCYESPNTSNTCTSGHKQNSIDNNDSDSDNWDNDNCPEYSIYTTNSYNNNIVENKTQKLTKNQKKRNRRKAAIASQTKTIWD